MDEIVNKWYSNVSVQFEILKAIKKRECVILGDMRVRCMFPKTVYEMNSNFKRYDFLKGKNNFYYSLAKFDMKKYYEENELMHFSYSPAKRRKEMDIFNKKFEKYITGYDLGLDFDAHNGINFDKAYKDCYKLIYAFKLFKVPYTLKCSGSGFHVEVDHKYLPDKIKNEKDPTKKCKIMGMLAMELMIGLDLETLDIGDITGSFYEPRRIFKVPYTIDHKTGNVALPLTDEQFKNFTFELVNPTYILKNIQIRNRGLLERAGDPKGFNKMVEQMELLA